MYDVAVDVRRESPSFGQWAAVELSAENHRQLYVPEGFAHGFCVLEESALLSYMCTTVFRAEYDSAIAWNDPDIGIRWPIDDGSLSAKEFIEDGRYMTRQARQGIFRASDANGDGIVSEEEYVTNRIITDEAKAIMSRMDADGDGRVTQKEFLGHSGLPKDPSNAIFNEFDTDGNGELVVPEYLRVWGRWARGK